LALHKVRGRELLAGIASRAVDVVSVFESFRKVARQKQVKSEVR
jgi:hypothetical protein